MTVAGNEERFDSKRYGWLFACLAGIMIVVVFADETLGCEAHSVKLYVGTIAADAESKSHKSLLLEVGITEYYVYVEWRAGQYGTESENDFDIWVWEDLASDRLIVSEENFEDEGGTMSVTLKVDTTPYSGALGAATHSIYAKVERHGTSPHPEINSINNECTVVIVKVDKIQYYNPITGYTDITSTIYVKKGSTVTFRAVKYPSGLWPDGKPVWGGTAGASGTGDTKNVTFNTVSSSTTDYKTVTAECGNTETVNVIVFDFDGDFTPGDDFASRSTTDYGLEEEVDLSCDVQPSGLTVSTLGGLLWSISGFGDLSGENVSTGEADYDAEETAGNVILYLTVDSGASEGHFKFYSKTVVAPSSAYMDRDTTYGIWHESGKASVGFKGLIYLNPKDVSFSNLDFREGYCTGTGTDFLSFKTGEVHPTGSWITIGSGDSTTGCEVQGTDEVGTGKYSSPFGSGGTFSWPIPWQYKDDSGTPNPFTTATHYETVDSAGKAGISKAGSGTFYKNLSDSSSSY